MNEVEEEKLPLFTRLNDAIDSRIYQFGEFIADAAEDKEGWTDDAVRGTLRGLQWIGNLPVLKQLGQLEEGLVGFVGDLAEKQDFIDPRSFTYTTRVGTAFIPYTGAVKTVGKLNKVRKIAKTAKAFKQGDQIFDAFKTVQDPTLIPPNVKMNLRNQLVMSIDNPNQNPLFDLNTFTTPVTETIEKVKRKFKPKSSSVQLQTQFPWEIAQGDPKIFRSNRSTPAPLNQYEMLVASGTKKQRAFFKGDIELNEFSFGKKGDKYNLDRFERRILDLMEADRIEALNVPAGKFTAIPGKKSIPVTPASLKRVQNLYADYVAGYFNQHIAGGTEVDFSKLARLTKDGVPLIDLLDEAKRTKVMRELRLLEIDPTVYKSGAFNPSSKTNKAKAAEIIREAMDANVKRNVKDIYQVDLHHLDQVSEGFNLYKGLDRIERGKMRELLKELGLNPGNHPKNVIRILNRDHVALHKRFWPKSKKRLAKMGFYDYRLRSLKTAQERLEFAKAYVEETKRAAEQAVQRTQKTIDKALDKRLFPSKTQEMDQYGRPKAIPKSG